MPFFGRVFLRPTHARIVVVTKPSNVAALEAGSGISWEEWLKFLGPHGSLDHTTMARVVRDHIVAAGTSANPNWWAQGVTVAYEQHIGRRLPGQRPGGSFSMTASTTVDGDMDAALARWVETVGTQEELNGVPPAAPARTSATEKWRHWRCGLADGSTVAVSFQTKPDGRKTTIAVGHDKLTDPDATDEWRTYWKRQLDAIKR